MQIKKVLLLVSLIIILIGIVSAEEISNDTSSTDYQKIIKESTTSSNMMDTSIKEEKNKKGINKKLLENKRQKTLSYTTKVSSYDELVNKIDEAKDTNYEKYTINLEDGYYKATSVISWGNTKGTKKLIINGNNNTIEGWQTNQFININKGYSLVLKNTVITAFRAKGTSIIENYGDNTIIQNCVFDNTDERYACGMSIENYAKNVIIKNNTFKQMYSGYETEGDHFDASAPTMIQGDGTIYNEGNNLTITMNTFENCEKSDSNGYYNGYCNGVINNKGNTITISKNSFKYCEKVINSGANNIKIIYNHITNNRATDDEQITCFGKKITFSYNNFKDNGGCLKISGNQVNIKYNNFTGNPGAISNNADNTNITNNNFISNSATYGGALYIIDGSNVKISKNVFKENEGGFGGAIYTNDAQTTIYNNTFKVNNGQSERLVEGSGYAYGEYGYNWQTYGYGGAIYSYNSNDKIEKNIFHKNNAYNLGNSIVTNKSNIIIKNNKFTGNKTEEINTVDSKTSISSNEFDSERKITKITISTIKQKTYKQNMTITGKLTDKTGKILKNTNIKVKVNTKTYTTKTNSKGVYTVKITANKVGTNNITVTYAGNKNYKAITKKTTFKTVARATKITVNKISTTTKGKTVKITGKLTDNLKSPVINSLVKVKVNNKTVSIKTNKLGVYTYNYKTTTKGTNNVTVTFYGSKNYKTSKVKSTFKVI